MTNALPIAAIAVSLALIAWLWRGDPKRRRVAGLHPIGHSAGKRRLLTFAVALPGIVLAVLGDSAAFLVWLGSCSIGGLLVTQLRFDGDKA